MTRSKMKPRIWGTTTNTTKMHNTQVSCGGWGWAKGGQWPGVWRCTGHRAVLSDFKPTKGWCPLTG